MKKNVASQVIGVQMVSATDGSAFTGAVTVSVTGDGGTQATGSVGSGACTHEGNGYHTYAPAQAETNYDQIAFTFTGTGAVPATVQVYTTFPQTGDSFARLGAPAGASVSADVAAVKTQTAAIEVDTADIQTRLPAALVSGRIDASVGAMAANVLTATAINADAITAAKLAADVTTELQSGLATAASIAALNNLSSTDVATAVWNAATASYGSAGSYGLLIETNLDAAISSRLSTAGYTAPDNTSITAILADTNELQTDWANGGRLDLILDARASQTSVDTIDGIVDTLLVTSNKLDDTLEDDAGTYRFTTNALEQAPTGGSAPSAADIADAVWNEAQADHVAAGSFGEIAGEIAIILVDVLDTKAATLQVKNKTDNLPTDPADASVIDGRFNTLDSSISVIDGNVDAVKAKTDQLTFTVANQVDANTESMNGATILGDGTSGNLWRGS